MNRAAFTCTTGRGKTYYLPTGPKRGGGIQYVSTDPKAELVERELQKCQTNQHCCLAEVSDDKIILHEGNMQAS